MKVFEVEHDRDRYVIEMINNTETMLECAGPAFLVIWYIEGWFRQEVRLCYDFHSAYLNVEKFISTVH